MKSGDLGLTPRFASAVVALLIAATVLLVGGPAHAVTVDNNNQPIAFSNVSAVGSSAAVGFTYRYEDAVTIGSQIVDVIFTLKAKTAGATVSTIDESGAPSGATNAMINSTLNFGGSTDSVTYQLDFVENNTSTPITLQNVAINVGDIDLLQFAQFAGITNYRLSTASAVNPTSSVSVLTPQTATGSIPAGAYRFQSTSGSSTAADEENWVEVRYAEINSLEIVLGATQSGGAYFSIDFQPASWPVPAAVSVTTPTATSYTVSYDGNTSDSGSVPSSTTGTGSQTVLGNTGPLVKAGYTFGGWNTAANGTGATYVAGSSIIPVGNVTLYAIWNLAPATFTLAYDPNTASSGLAPTSTSGSGSVALAPSAGTLSKPGFTFSGWNTAADGSGASYQPGAALNLTSNVTLYAMWTPAVAPLTLASTGVSDSQLLLAALSLALLSLGLGSVTASRKLRK